MCGKGTLNADSARSSTSNLSSQLANLAQPSPALSPSPDGEQHPFFDYRDERAHLHVSGGVVVGIAMQEGTDVGICVFGDVRRINKLSVVSCLLRRPCRRAGLDTASRSTA